MPFALALIGIIFIVSAAKGTEAALGQQLVADFTGQNNFFYWVAAILAIGAVGYIKPLRPLSWALLALVLVVMFMADGTGFWSQINSALGTAAAPAGGPPASSGTVTSAPTAPTPQASATPSASQTFAAPPSTAMPASLLGDIGFGGFGFD